jgi:hypothetical protein
MSTRITAGLILGVAAFGLAGYGLGSGWIRFGAPDRDVATAVLTRLERDLEATGGTQAELLPVPRVDGQVIRAQSSTPAPSTPASAIKEIREADPEAAAGGAGTPPEYVTRDFTRPVLLRSAKFAIVIDSTTDPTAAITVAGQPGTRDNNKARFNIDLTSNLSSASGRQSVMLTTGTPPMPTGKVVTVIVPGASGLIPPVVMSAANGVANDPTPIPTDSDNPPYITIYGTYLRLLGQDAPIGDPGDLGFYVYAQEGNDFVFKTPVPDSKTSPNAATRTWDATMTLPDLTLGTPARLFVVAKGPSDQRFSKKVVIQRAPIAFELGKTPTIEAIYLPGPDPTNPATNATKVDPIQDPARPNYQVGSRTLLFGGSGAKKDTRVLIYIDGLTAPFAKSAVLKADGPWQTALSAPIPDSATHTARATMSQGDEEKQFSPQTATFQVSTDGPTIDSVGVTSPGPALGLQALVVRFKGNTLDTNTAKSASNYALQPSNGTGVYDTNVSSAVTPDSVDFADKTNTVTLQFKSLKPDEYRLSVKSLSKDAPNGLKDVYGNPVAPPLTKVVSKSPDEGGETVDAIPKPEKAPNAVFPEWNKPRPPTNGFNESDHVDTRVCRLYYYRDARRVAEIINRDLKSYNQAAVDTRRRLAEKARTSADSLTDQRRQQEVKAVRAAQASREVQRRLDKAQSDLQQSQTSMATANQNLPVLQAKQASLQQQLNAASNAANPPPPANGAAVPAQPAASAAVVSLQAQLDAVGVQITQAQNAASQAASQIGDQTAAVQAAQADLQAARASEAQSSDVTLKDQAQEDRARESQFRLEVAAAHEDPNSYAPGQPDSVDPVLQVSISVIGEGVIQLRGPMKGINLIRRMINEIDTPAGQVRIALHTVQINGEREKRMEKVAARIQYYVDHARFLTVQSSQILRNAVVKVASAKAEQACAEPLPDKVKDAEAWAASQELRDRKYQEAFFGTDFINELHEIDAEFLHTGNKLLSLHSMDTTSLASALFLLALAKNDTRLEILDQFKTELATLLPDAEAKYTLAAGRTGDECPKVYPMAQNSQFQSFQGFFNAEVDGTDTLNPLQREFIKLAQILKSRLVTELEYNQRFKERSLIEDRLGDYIQELKIQKDREENARKVREASRKTVNFRRAMMSERFSSIASFIGDDQQDVDTFRGDIRETKKAIDRIIKDNRDQLAKPVLAEAAGKGQLVPPGETKPIAVVTDDDAKNYLTYLAPKSDIRYPRDVYAEIARLDQTEKLLQNVANAGFTIKIRGVDKKFIITRGDGIIEPDIPNGTTADDLKELRSIFYRWIDQDKAIRGLAAGFRVYQEYEPFAAAASRLLDHLLADIVTINRANNQPSDAPITSHIVFEYAKILTYYSAVVSDIRGLLRYTQRLAQEVTDGISIDDASPSKSRDRWQDLKRVLDLDFLGEYHQAAVPIVDAIDRDFEELTRAFVTYKNAERDAAEARQPLDAKKLLDMLIDEMEDKYIELLEGMRSHTANIDGYVKAIATALDDDFNTQFYYPAFAEIRKSSTFYDVTLGQVETTNILTNNRMFAKVEPQATMEFDLPKRDILINEAMNGALAMTKDFGALVADPDFLALAKLKSGQPTASPAQGFGGGANTVRNVLPGLPTSNDEQPLSQGPSGNRQFGSAMEALIPDPAIYKFETGTGFEIRPVIQPDGQSVVFHLDYMYTTNIREPVRADEKHLGRIKRHFIDTEVQLGNYELREVSRYSVALKAARTSRGVPLFEDIPGLGILFRPLPSASSSFQQNVILSQATIFPTLFDLMGLRIAPSVADLDTLRLRNHEFVVRGRKRDVMNRVFDYSTSRVDEYLKVAPAERRPDLYRTQETIPDVHPNGYHGPGLNLHDSQLQEGYDPTRANPPSRYVPRDSDDIGTPNVPGSAPSSSLVPPRRRGLDPETLQASRFGVGTGVIPSEELPPLPTPSADERAVGNRADPIPPPRVFQPSRPSSATSAAVPSATPSRMRPAPARQAGSPSKGRTPAAPSTAATEGTKPRRGFFSRLRGTDQ